MFCANCGIEQRDGTKFCPDCGYDMLNNKATSHTLVRRYGSKLPSKPVITNGHQYRRELFPLDGHSRLIYDYTDDDDDLASDTQASGSTAYKSKASKVVNLALRIFAGYFAIMIIIVLIGIIVVALEGW